MKKEKVQKTQVKRDFAIRSKVIMIGVVAVLVSVFIGLIGQYYTGRVQNLYTMQNQTKSIDTLLLEGIIKEKEFLASGEASLKGEVVQIFDEMIQILETDLLTLPEANDEIKGHLESVLAGVIQYKDNFVRIDSLNTDKGLEDTAGYMGQLSNDLEAITSYLDRVPGDYGEVVELKPWQALFYPQEEADFESFPVVTVEGSDYYSASFEYDMTDKPQRDNLSIKINGINNNIDTYVITNLVISGPSGDYEVSYDSVEAFEADWSYPESGAVKAIAMGEFNGVFALLFDVDYSEQETWGYADISMKMSDDILVADYDTVTFDILQPVESNGGIIVEHYTKVDIVDSVPHRLGYDTILTLEDLYFVESFIHTYVMDPEMVLMTEYIGQINELYTEIYDTMHLTMLSEEERKDYEGLLLEKQDAMNNIYASDQALTQLRLDNADLQKSIEASTAAVGQGAADLVAKSNVNDARNRIVILIISSILLLVIVVWINRSIQKSFKGFMEVLKKNAQGSLTTRAYTGGPREFRDFAGYLNSFLNQLSQVISGIGRVSEDVEQNNNVVASDMEQLIGSKLGQTSSDEQSIMVMNQLVIDMNDKAEMQQASTEAALSGLEEISASSDQILENIDNTKTLSQASVDKTAEGYQSIEQIQSGVNQITSNIDITNDEINELSEQSKNIVEILSAIRNISSQTNLLALNASIEAARAGEEGKGFSVVADEVRKLAEQTEGEAAKIGEIINAISVNIKEVLQSTEGVKGSLGDLIKVIELFDQIFKEIIDTIENSNDSVNLVSETIKEQLLAVNSIAENVSEISADAGSIGVLTKSTTKIMEAITQVLYENHDKLNAVAKDAVQLNEEVQFFQVD